MYSVFIGWGDYVVVVGGGVIIGDFCIDWCVMFFGVFIFFENNDIGVGIIDKIVMVFVEGV